MRNQAIGRIVAVGTILGLLPSLASAHYLWVTVNSQPAPHGITNIYFEHAASPGNGEYLDRFLKNGTSWIRTSASQRPSKLDVEEVKSSGKRWLMAKLPAKGPRSIDSSSKFGVYTYGKTNVLLNYHARQLDISSRDQLPALARATHQSLEIVPEITDKTLTVTVLWKGKPVSGRKVIIRGAKGFRQSTPTNDDGQVTFELKQGGLYSFRTDYDWNETGTDNGEDYTIIRHHATLRMVVPATKLPE